MGQYYFVVNLDKKQMLCPHRFGDGQKLMEFGMSGGGTLTALAVLLADGNGRGGGDLESKNPIVGSWAGDRIVIAGDYGNKGKFVDDPQKNLYKIADELFEDVSQKVLRAMADDEFISDDMKQQKCWNGDVQITVYDYAMADQNRAK